MSLIGLSKIVILLQHATLILRPIHFIGAPNFSSCSLKYLFRLEEIVYLFVLKKLEVWNGRDRVQVGEFL